MNRTNWRRYLAAALLGIAVHWLILFLGFAANRLADGQPLTGFFAALYDRVAQAGDVPHYVEIALHGYQGAGETANNIVFFPLYPLLIRAMRVLVPDAVTAGMIVSNLFLGAASAAVYALLEAELGDRRAMRGLAIFSLMPYGFFMAGAYTESLFIALAALCMRAIAKRRWLWAGALGFLAALTRAQGIALLVPMVYEICLDIRGGKKTPRMLAALLIPAGTCAYLALNAAVCGNPFAFLAYQAAAPWYNTSHWIPHNLAQHFSLALEYPGLGVFIYWPQLALYFAALALLFAGLKKGLRPSFIALGGAYLLMTYLHGWMISGPRYLLSCLPLYLSLSALGNEDGTALPAVPLGALSVLTAMWYLQGQAIM